MALTPIEVENTQFRVAFRGYAIDEVDAFLDRVQAELSRLLTQQAAAPATAAAPAAPVTPGLEGQEAALRTLLLAQRTADEAVAEARAEAEQLRSAARDEADVTLTSARDEAATTLTAARDEAATTLTAARDEAATTLAAARDEANATLTSARDEAAATLASAREQAERLLAASRDEAAGLDQQIAQRLEAALGDLDRRRSRLEGRIERLQAFEREYRTRLRAHLEGQLRELVSDVGSDDDGVGAPAGGGAAPVGRAAVGGDAVGAVRLVSRADPAPTSDGAPDPAAAPTDR